MVISNFNLENNNRGFTIVELVVVLAGLAALASFSIPSIFRSIKLNRVEEAKALMNSYAADCLSKYRISTNPLDFIEKATPDQLDNIKLSTLEYQIDGEKDKCSHLAIKPLNENEKDLFSFDFRMSSDGEIVKTGTPSDNPNFLNSCRSWAGKNCGLSEAQKAEFARLAALAKAKSECISKFNAWLNTGSSGEFVSWDNNNESCNRPVFAFEGTPVNSAEAVEQAQQAKYGLACAKWRGTQRDEKTTSQNPLTKSPECGGVNYWYHSGTEFLSQAAWNEYDDLLKAQACNKDRSDALSQGVKGKYTYGPTPGPDPCGKVVWLCNGEEFSSLSGYETSTCSPPPDNGSGDDNEEECIEWSRNPLCGMVPNHPMCKPPTNACEQ